MNAKTKRLFERLPAYAWLLALAVALIVSALNTDRQARQVAEYPCCCDPFGYLQMAQDIRNGVREGRCPEFAIESTHTRLLIDLMKSRGVPLPVWADMVGPLAYRYFPGSDRVVVRYPPGAGLMLALFPQDRALHSVNRIAEIAFVVGGLLLLVFAAVKRTWLAAGLLILALELGLEILAKIDNSSFSINAMLAPLWLSALCLWAAFALPKAHGPNFYLRWFLFFLAGLLFGFAILVRLPLILLLPGILILLWPVSLRRPYKSGVLSFGLGVLSTGLIPVAIHQSRLAGAWYRPTYPPDDMGAPRMEYFWSNLASYFGSGRFGAGHWILLIILIGFVGLFVWVWSRDRDRSGSLDPNNRAARGSKDWKRLLASAFVMWAVPVVYFLTHQHVQPYYLAPSLFGTALVLGLGAFGVESHRPTVRQLSFSTRRIPQLLALALALAPGIIAIQRAWSNYERPSLERRAPRFELAPELADERAWIWADDMSGTLWYYARKPAHKINSTNKETRALVYEFVKNRGEPQYLIGDDPPMKPVEDEIQQLGGRLELRGEVDGRAYYLIHWSTMDR